jgi:morphogenetic protein associated with SpoVID
MPENQMPYPQVQGAYMPENQMPYPQVQGAYMPELENENMYEESSPLMQQSPNEMENNFYNPAPQVQGETEEFDYPEMGENAPYMQGQMPSMTLPAMQMPTPGYQPYPPMKNDCGCGGPKPFHHLGGYGVHPGYHPSQMMQGGYPMQQPAHMGYGSPAYGPMQGMGPNFGNPYRNVSPYGYGFEPEIQEKTVEEGSEYNG